MKKSITVTLDHDVFEKFGEIMNKKEMSRSEFVNNTMKKQVEIWKSENCKVIV